jgi:uncharacterized RDD family membrane protein YckC
MKCPKCEYLGFETGDRCKNCGYDFSLSAEAAPRDPELPLRAPEPIQNDADRWLHQLEARLDVVRPAASSASAAPDALGAMSLAGPSSTPPIVVEPVELLPTRSLTAQPPVRHVSPRGVSVLPLFHPGGADSDEPLIKVPAAPRPPLAVRRTPEKPRLRTVPKPVRRIPLDQEHDPVLAFAEEPGHVLMPRTESPAAESRPTSQRPATSPAFEISGPVRRITAAFVDHVILLSIDVVVVYFTFQIAGLPFSAWRTIPLVPLALFLMMVKGSYFCVFTMLGGQTVGKMATRIRVVDENDHDVEPSRAVQRTLAALASVATVGIGFAPVLFAGDRRTLHDRVAGTRVVGPLHE